MFSLQIYLMRTRGLIKIGIASSPMARQKQVQQQEEFRVVLLCTASPHGVDAKRHERRLHKMFAHVRVRGEWFEDIPEIHEEFKKLRGYVPFVDRQAEMIEAGLMKPPKRVWPL